MTTRGQILRSSVTGNIPAPATRAAGELWANFADKQMGVIDASRTAQKLLAVRYFAATAAYVAGDVVVQAGEIYIAKASIAAGAFNSAQWNQIAWISDILAPYVLPTASTTTLGGVKIDGSTININGAGVISSAGLVTVAASAPSPVQNGALWFDLVGGQLYVWANDGSSSQWVVAVNQSLGGVYLPMTGGVLTGPLTLAADPVNPLDASTKQYVDAKPGPINDNRIINGDMRIDQRGVASTSTGTAFSYTVDRWSYGSGTASKLNWTRNNNQGTLPAFPYGLLFTSLSAYTPAVTEFFQLYQSIEADTVSDFAWGTSQAQPVTLSFWAYSSLTGTFSGAINSAASPRSYPFAFSLPTASTWTKIVITIPGDTGGTWTMNGNAAALTLAFDLGSGTNYRGAANAWVNAGLIGVTGAVRVVSTSAANFLITGVKLEVGSVATPYNRQSLAKSQADCQRYYQLVVCNCRVAATGPSLSAESGLNYQTMRASPTATVFAAGTPQNLAGGVPQINQINPAGARFSIASAAAGDCLALNYTYAFSAEL